MSSPTLATGLAINASTCAISGTPTVPQGATSYVITEKSSVGSGTGMISISLTGTLASFSGIVSADETGSRAGIV